MAVLILLILGVLALRQSYAWYRMKPLSRNEKAKMIGWLLLGIWLMAGSINVLVNMQT